MRQAIFATLLVLGSAPAHAAVVDSFTLDMNGSNGATGVNSNVALGNGMSYLVTVSGTFEIGCYSGGCPADAEYYWPQASPYNGVTPFDNTGFSNTTGLDVGVMLDGVKVDWGAPNPAHVYSVGFLGTGSTVYVNYADSGYGDNVGSLQVKIETIGNGAAVPLPSTLAMMLGGLAAVGGFGAARRIRG